MSFDMRIKLVFEKLGGHRHYIKISKISWARISSFFLCAYHQPRISITYYIPFKGSSTTSLERVRNCTSFSECIRNARPRGLYIFVCNIIELDYYGSVVASTKYSRCWRYRGTRVGCVYFINRVHKVYSAERYFSYRPWARRNKWFHKFEPPQTVSRTTIYFISNTILKPLWL